MRYILKKIGIFVLTLFIVSFLVFIAFQIIPGDPATRMLGTSATPEKLEAMREQLGLNEPRIVQYLNWLKGFVTGDLGMSYVYNMPVSDLIAQKLPITLALTGLSFVLVVFISLPLGVLLTRFSHSLFDRIFMVINQLFMSLPSFFVGIIFTYFFGLTLHFFTVGNFVHFDENPVAFWTYLFFAALAIAIPKSAMVTKLFRTGMVKEMNEDYVRTAYSHGCNRRRVLYNHVMRNSIIPVVTFLAVTLVDILAGSIIIEQVFAIPGMGRGLLDAILKRDIFVAQSITMIIATVVISLNYLADMSYKYIDPRIRFR